MLVELFAAPSDTQILLSRSFAGSYCNKQVFLLHMDLLAISTSDPYFYQSVWKLLEKCEIYFKV